MTGTKDTVYEPDRGAAAVYRDLYILYQQLHDAFGGVQKHAGGGAGGDAASGGQPAGSRTMGNVMKDLIGIRDAVRKA